MKSLIFSRETVIEKTKTFVFEAGKIILAISIILWVLASYGPGDKFNNAESYIQTATSQTSNERNDQIAAFKLEHSYIGIVGKTKFFNRITYRIGAQLSIVVFIVNHADGISTSG